MYSPVLIELGGGQEVFSAVRADVFPLDGVSLQVLPEGAVVGVGLAAQFAHGVTDVHVVLC